MTLLRREPMMGFPASGNESTTGRVSKAGVTDRTW